MSAVRVKRKAQFRPPNNIFLLICQVVGAFTCGICFHPLCCVSTSYWTGTSPPGQSSGQQI